MAKEKETEKRERRVPVTLKKYSYGMYRISEKVGDKVLVSKELAEKMKKSGHAE